jgi:hypothetical protein
MQQRAGETPHRARNPELQKKAAIDVRTHPEKSLRRADEVRDRYGSNRQPGVDMKRENRGQETADSKS